MQIGLLLLALAFPLLELAVLIKVGQTIGLWWTLMLLVAMGIGGGLVVQQQGLTAARRAMEEINHGRPPIEPVVDSFMLMLAGVLLVIPGLLTDMAGLALLVPPVRRSLARWALGRMVRDADIQVETREWRSPGRNGRGSGTVIDGEWERVDDPKTPPKPLPPETDRRS